MTRRINELKRAYLFSLLVFPIPVHLCSTLQDFQSYSKTVPQISVETLCWHPGEMSRAEQNPRPTSCLKGCIIGSSEERGIQSLADFPDFFFFFSRQHIMFMPYKFFGRDSQRNGKKMLPLIPRNHQCKHTASQPDQAGTFFSTEWNAPHQHSHTTAQQGWQVIR